jgi:hypothetical protein
MFYEPSKETPMLVEMEKPLISKKRTTRDKHSETKIITTLKIP